MNDETDNLIITIVWLAAYLSSLIHVFIDSKNDKNVGFPIRHTLMISLVIWPISYLCWIFWWPGKLRQAIFGSDKEKAQRWAQELIAKYQKKGRLPSE